MKAMEELATLSLLGCERPVTLPALPEEIEAFVDRNAPAASQLLTAAAVVARYRRAGVLPIAGLLRPEHAPANRLRPCSRRAAELLSQAIQARDVRLVHDWCLAARRGGFAVPHQHLPAFLDLSGSNTMLRAAAIGVIDERGVWLSRLNDDWNSFHAPSSGTPDPAVWSTGTTSERLAALTTVRAAEPDAARALIESTWKDDPADLRIRCVETLSVRLSMNDEPFLEAALDDRSKLVRHAAASLLARLPESRFAIRMVERVAPLLQQTDTQPRTLEIRLPDAWDPQWERDGLTEKPTEKIGRRAWWLEQLIASLPLGFWQRAAQTPAELSSAIVGDERRPVLRALARAAVNHRDVEWAIAILPDVAEEDRQIRRSLIEIVVSAGRFTSLPVTAIPTRPAEWRELADVLDDPWPTDVAAKFSADCARWASTNIADTDTYALSDLLSTAAFALPIGAAEQCVEPVSKFASERVHTAADRFVSVVQTRQQVAKELVP